MTMPPDPTPPEGTPPGYGGPPPSGYGAPPPGYGQAPGWTGPPLASWGDRVVAALIDYFAPFIVAAVAFRVSTALGGILYLAAFVWVIYQKLQEGKTGKSMGKQIAGTQLLGELTGQPIGGGAAVGRWLLHIVDGLPCYLGYLWPLWDAKKQTFADKIMKTVVIKG